jgi:hypothetical protein
MSHSTHVGFSEPPAVEGCTARPKRLFTGTVPFATASPVSSWSRLVGVGHRSSTCAIRFGTGTLRTCPGEARWSHFGLPSRSEAVGVCHISASLPCAENGLLPLRIAVASSSVISPSSTLARSRRTLPSFGRSIAVGVGHDPDPVAEVRGTNGTSWDAVPFRVIPEGGQVAKDCPHPSVSSQESWDVLHEDVTGS